MDTVLLTGGAGFLGRHLKRRLLDSRYFVVSFDLEPDEDQHPNLLTVQGDVRRVDQLAPLFDAHQFAAIFHCAAAVVAHAIKDADFVRSTNVDGTKIVADLANEYHVPRIVFISTCCLWKSSLGRPVLETDAPDPGEIYGWSKMEGEKVLLDNARDYSVVILRSPTVMDAGRMGLMSILFEFIEEGKRVWVVGDGRNRHQFVSARDLVEACMLALTAPGNRVYNVGSDNVPSLRAAYEFVVKKAGTAARVKSLPRRTSLLAMRLAYRLGISPLGPYQYRMIAEDFVFDTARIKQELGWRPTSTNDEMLWEAYAYYRDHRNELRTRDDLSAHRRPARLGVIRLLKWVS